MKPRKRCLPRIADLSGLQRVQTQHHKDDIIGLRLLGSQFVGGTVEMSIDGLEYTLEGWKIDSLTGTIHATWFGRKELRRALSIPVSELVWMPLPTILQVLRNRLVNWLA